MKQGWIGRCYRCVTGKMGILHNLWQEMFAHAGWFLLGRKQRKTVQDNKSFRDKYKGKRCFIIGNGPSLKEQDLALLKDEYVFTVNQMMRDDRFEEVCPDFHVIADPLYFNLDLENPYHRKVADLIAGINRGENRPECFFPIQAKPFIDKLQLQGLSVHYFFSGCKMYENYNRKMDFAKSVPGFYNVVQYAITLAMYCGFSEIYLLGCDMTGYREIEEQAYGTYEQDMHCYHLTEEEKKNVLHKGRTCEAYFDGFAHMFADYRRLAEYAEEKGIKLVNATAGGVLDSLPRTDYEKLFKFYQN